MAEQTFFSSGSVTVTQARFVVDGQTYAMQGVTSVRRELAQPSKKRADNCRVVWSHSRLRLLCVVQQFDRDRDCVVVDRCGDYSCGSFLVPGSKSYPLRDFELRVGGIKGSLEQG